VSEVGELLQAKSALLFEQHAKPGQLAWPEGP
jgi:hypothetical protein